MELALRFPWYPKPEVVQMGGGQFVKLQFDRGDDLEANRALIRMGGS